MGSTRAARLAGTRQALLIGRLFPDHSWYNKWYLWHMTMRAKDPLWIRLRLGGVLALGALCTSGILSCSDTLTETCACTTEFRFFTVTVVDAQGQPAEGVEISARRVSDGLDLTPDDVGLGQPGVYVVLTDNAVDHVTEEGTLVEVVGTRGDTGLRAEFVFNRDDCQCHVSQVSGPGTVQLEPLPLP